MSNPVPKMETRVQPLSDPVLGVMVVIVAACTATVISSAATADNPRRDDAARGAVVGDEDVIASIVVLEVEGVGCSFTNVLMEWR
jgi:hypothetical protein